MSHKTQIPEFLQNESLTTDFSGAQQVNDIPTIKNCVYKIFDTVGALGRGITGMLTGVARVI